MTTHPLIIIGTGLAGYHLAKTFRKYDEERELILITEDEGHFYSKSQLSTAIAQKKLPEQLIITPVDKMAAQLNATILSFSHVHAIHPEEKYIEVQTPTETRAIEYGHLVLATGAVPKPLPLLEDLASVFRVNRWDAYARFRQILNEKDHLTILGSGLVGCELAYDLRHFLSALTLLTPDPYPLYGLVPEKIGSALGAVLTQRGIRCLTTHSLTDVIQTHSSAPLEITTQQGTSFNTDKMLVAIGLQPYLDLAQKAGLATRQGIIVDAYLQTSHAGIYALGDCAEIEGRCRQYVAPLLHCAQQLARTLCHTPSAINFPPYPISLKIDAYPIISLPPAPGTKGEWSIQSNNASHKALFRDEEDELKGYVLSGSFIEERQACLAEFQAQQVVY